MAKPNEPLTLNSLDRDLIFLFFASAECDRAINALEEVFRLAAIETKDEERSIISREWLTVFNAIRLALHFASSVSRIFFPSAGNRTAEQRGVRLRRLTGLSDSHAIKSRALRNHIEHMDERMDEWTSPSPRPFGGTVEMTTDSDMARNTVDSIEASCPFIYYRATRRVRIFSEEHDLVALQDALRDVHEHVSRAVVDWRDPQGQKSNRSFLP